jgi:hypothetical protein
VARAYKATSFSVQANAYVYPDALEVTVLAADGSDLAGPFTYLSLGGDVINPATYTGDAWGFRIENPTPGEGDAFLWKVDRIVVTAGATRPTDPTRSIPAGTWSPLYQTINPGRFASGGIVVTQGFMTDWYAAAPWAYVPGATVVQITITGAQVYVPVEAEYGPGGAVTVMFIDGAGSYLRQRQSPVRAPSRNRPPQVRQRQRPEVTT